MHASKILDGCMIDSQYMEQKQSVMWYSDIYVYPLLDESLLYCTGAVV